MVMLINNKEVAITGRFPRTAKLADEYEWVEDPIKFSEDLRSMAAGADVFSFLGKITQRESPYHFIQSIENISVIPLTTYQSWWKSQINDKTRNMIRKSQKAGVEVRLVEFTDELVWGIKNIYDESPLRQGKPFKHHGKAFDILKKEHITFLERSQFIGAYYENKLVGFIKLVHGEGLSHTMQIISKQSYRSMAPTNALLAKAVEICTQRQVPYLHYGLWSKRSLGEFKRHNAFECLTITRYYIPLNWKGKLLLSLNLHRDLVGRMPEWLVDAFVNVRAKLYMLKNGFGKAFMAAPHR